jgi:hypothetical protein
MHQAEVAPPAGTQWNPLSLMHPPVGFQILAPTLDLLPHRALSQAGLTGVPNDRAMVVRWMLDSPFHNCLDEPLLENRPQHDRHRALTTYVHQS